MLGRGCNLPCGTRETQQGRDPIPKNVTVVSVSDLQPAALKILDVTDLLKLLSK